MPAITLDNMDVETAFLQSAVDEGIYVRQPDLKSMGLMGAVSVSKRALSSFYTSFSLALFS